MQQALNDSQGETLYAGRYTSPFGDCVIGICREKVAWLSFLTDNEGVASNLVWPHGPVDEAGESGRSFAEKIFGESGAANADLDLCLLGTDFQRRVWGALQQIPLGETWTYSELANSIGRPTAFRAVANAVGANPVSYLVPCHRVIRSDGGIGGYRWGIDVKQRILASEGIVLG